MATNIRVVIKRKNKFVTRVVTVLIVSHNKILYNNMHSVPRVLYLRYCALYSSTPRVPFSLKGTLRVFLEYP